MKLGINGLNIIGQEFSMTLLEIPRDQNFKYIIQVIKGKDSEANCWFKSRDLQFLNCVTLNGQITYHFSPFQHVTCLKEF